MLLFVYLSVADVQFPLHTDPSIRMVRSKLCNLRKHSKSKSSNAPDLNRAHRSPSTCRVHFSEVVCHIDGAGLQCRHCIHETILYWVSFDSQRLVLVICAVVGNSLEVSYVIYIRSCRVRSKVDMAKIGDPYVISQHGYGLFYSIHQTHSNQLNPYHTSHSTTSSILNIRSTTT